MTATYPDRVFQLWEYRVSHGALLVRSPRGPDRTTNVDLLFAGVELISCPRLLRGLVVEQAGPDDVRAARAALGQEIDAPLEVFVLVSEGRRNVVVASSLRLHEHQGDIFDSPFADSRPTGPRGRAPRPGRGEEEVR
ncbi:hypothetical protein [Cellulomonas telluris]|uniref:hypothetical protein n=1 Tax=Cellulomonas telluris TaxID=2306636 RepID=UPI0010A7AB56|nr:hypothetical protein [Cellulomonas telluris]